MNPAEGTHLIHDAIVARHTIIRLLTKLWVAHETKRAHAVFDAAIYDPLFDIIGLNATVISRKEAATMDIHEHRQFVVFRSRGRTNAEIQAVFRHSHLASVLVGVKRLRRTIPPVVGLIHRIPSAVRYGGFPAQIAKRCLGIRDIHIKGITIFEHTGNLALRNGCLQDRTFRLMAGSQ